MCFAMTSTAQHRVFVRAPARLHLGFLDMHGGLGRRFGSMGLCLQEIATELCATRTADITAEGPDADRAVRYAKRIMAQIHPGAGAHISVREAIPAHAGLGSGTQLALAVGAALCRLYGAEMAVPSMARMMGRGRRSGVGIGTFTQGGFIMDAGRSGAARTPPVISRLPVPENWRFLLLLDPVLVGISGKEEGEAFSHLSDMPRATAGELCRLALMRILPALVEEDCAAFGDGVSRVQQVIGEYFASVQNGVYRSPAVEEALGLLLRHGATGAGQSSWGPTGFAVFASETGAYKALRLLRRQWPQDSGIEFLLCRAQNNPAVVRADDTAVKSVRRR
jgi:beta-RFAP synthase